MNLQSSTAMADKAPTFETIQVGDEVPGGSYYALTIIDAVRWAGFQENYAQLHYDREFARSKSKIPSFIASGAYRESLMVRLLTDWTGPKGRLCKLKTRQTYSTFEGDSIRYSGRVVEKSSDPEDPWVVLEMQGFNQDDRQTLQSEVKLMLESGGKD